MKLKLGVHQTIGICLGILLWNL